MFSREEADTNFTISSLDRQRLKATIYYTPAEHTPLHNRFCWEFKRICCSTYSYCFLLFIW